MVKPKFQKHVCLWFIRMEQPGLVELTVENVDPSTVLLLRHGGQGRNIN